MKLHCEQTRQSSFYIVFIPHIYRQKLPGLFTFTFRSNCVLIVSKLICVQVCTLVMPSRCLRTDCRWRWSSYSTWMQSRKVLNVSIFTTTFAPGLKRSLWIPTLKKCVYTFVEKTKESRRKGGKCCDIYRSATVNADKTG